MATRNRILVVEDDDDMRQLMCMTLDRQGYEVTVAEDGIKGYELAIESPPDLIITDIHMPSADGVHLIRRVRDTEALAATPILVTTGYGTGSAALALSQGANAYERKPVEPENLLLTVRRLLSAAASG